MSQQLSSLESSSSRESAWKALFFHASFLPFWKNRRN